MFKKRGTITASRRLDKLSAPAPLPPPRPLPGGGFLTNSPHNPDGQDNKLPDKYPYVNAREGRARLKLTKPLRC